MKGVIVHGALLGVMLVYGYKTWTKEEATKPVGGEVVMWTRGEADVSKIEFQTDKRLVRIERRGAGADAYWWGTETKTIKKPKPIDAPPPADPAAPPPAPEFVDETTTTEFPVGPEGEKLVKQFARMRAIKSVGVPKDDVKQDYGLADSQTSIAVVFADGAKTLVVGGRVFGGGDRYLQDLDTNKAFVVLGSMVATLEGGEPSLRPTDLRAFDPKVAAAVEVSAKDKSKRVQKIKVKAPPPDADDPHAPPANADELIETWGQGATADTVVANFLDKLEKLRPTSYDAKLDVASLELVVSAAYKDGKGAPLGTIKLYRRTTPAPVEAVPPTPADPTKPAVDPTKPADPSKPATPPAADPTKPADPAAPATPADPAATKPADKVEYFLWTERTRVPGLLTTMAAERVEQDVPTLFAQ